MHRDLFVSCILEASLVKVQAGLSSMGNKSEWIYPVDGNLLTIFGRNFKLIHQSAIHCVDIVERVQLVRRSLLTM